MSSAPSAPSASATAVDPNIDGLKFSYAQLQYKSDQTSDWKILESVRAYDDANNITEVVISGQQVLLKQKYPNGAGTCILTIPRQNLSEPSFQVQEIPERQSSIFELSFKVVNQAPELEYGRTMPGNTDLHETKDYPLCRHLQSFHFLKLRLPEGRLVTHKNKSHQWYETLLLRLVTNVSVPASGINVAAAVSGMNAAENP
ncbi:MAG: hypothetical protein Q9226_008839 [Calogaya cf. arnoldii]